MDAIHTWRRGKTTIIITHDIGQIQPEDFVYILEKGKVIQDGYRADLERKSGPFQSFVKTFDAKGMGSIKPLIPELEPDYNSGDDFSVVDSMEKGYCVIPTGSPGSPTAGLRLLPEDRKGKPKQQIPSSPSLGIEMVRLPGARTRAKNKPKLFDRRLRREKLRLDRIPPSPVIEVGAGAPTTSRRGPARSFESGEITLRKIFATIWPSLNITNRFLLVVGFTAAFLHAAATPAFSFALARLLHSFFNPNNPPSQATKWSLVVLGISILDALNSYLMYYLFESVAQTWVDVLRNKSLARILDQPRVWFDENPAGTITADIEKNAEEMRDLLGRFAGHTFVGTLMILIGITWSFTVSWELTFVGVAIAPVMYAMTRGFAWASDKWERKSNEAAKVVAEVFEETITNIRTVRALALESYFRQKYARATYAASRVGFKRSLFAGIGFGLSDSMIMFASGEFSGLIQMIADTDDR